MNEQVSWTELELLFLKVSNQSNTALSGVKSLLGSKPRSYKVDRQRKLVTSNSVILKFKLVGNFNL